MNSVRSGDPLGLGLRAPHPCSTRPPPPTPTPRPGGWRKTGGPRKLLQMDSGYTQHRRRRVGDGAKRARSAPPLRVQAARPLARLQPKAPRQDAHVRPRSPRAWPRRAPAATAASTRRQTRYSTVLRHGHTSLTPCLPQRRHGSAAHHTLRKQWQQRGRQHSDPGHALASLHPIHGPIWYPPAPRAPLRRGDSVDCPPDGRAGGTTRPRPPFPSSRGTRWWMPGSPACALGPRVRCWTSWRPASATGSSHHG